MPKVRWCDLVLSAREHVLSENVANVYLGPKFQKNAYDSSNLSDKSVPPLK